MLSKLPISILEQFTTAMFRNQQKPGLQSKSIHNLFVYLLSCVLYPMYKSQNHKNIEIKNVLCLD